MTRRGGFWHEEREFQKCENPQCFFTAHSNIRYKQNAKSRPLCCEGCKYHKGSQTIEHSSECEMNPWSVTDAILTSLQCPVMEGTIKCPFPATRYPCRGGPLVLQIADVANQTRMLIIPPHELVDSKQNKPFGFENKSVEELLSRGGALKKIKAEPSSGSEEPRDTQAGNACILTPRQPQSASLEPGKIDARDEQLQQLEWTSEYTIKSGGAEVCVACYCYATAGHKDTDLHKKNAQKYDERPEAQGCRRPPTQGHLNFVAKPGKSPKQGAIFCSLCQVHCSPSDHCGTKDAPENGDCR